MTKRISFAVPNITATSITGTTRISRTDNNSSEQCPTQDSTENYGPNSDESSDPRKKKGFLKTYGCVPICFGILIILTAIVVPCVLLLTMYVSTSLNFPYGDCVLLEEYRTPCKTSYSNVGQRECEAVNCCWNTKTKKCYHSIPSRHSYLWNRLQGSTKVVKDTDFELSARLTLTPLLTSSYTQLTASVRFVSRSHLRILIGTPGSSLVSDLPSSKTNDSNLEVYLSEPAYAFEVYRKDDESNVPLISSFRSPLIASDNYWEIGLRCPPAGAAYGLGGLELKNTTLLYSSSSRSASIPYITCLDPDGKAHGLLIRNSGPMEVSFNNASKLIMLRALSNLGWDINIFSGPTPGDVVAQLTEIVGRPKLPPYWVLGFHVCRDFSSDEVNSTNINKTAIMNEFLSFHKSSISQGLPYDSDCIHERLLDHLNITASADVISDMAAAFDSLQNSGKKFLLSIAPQVVEGDAGSCIRQSNGSLYEGEYRKRKVFYPDFMNPNTSNWMASRLHILTSAATNMSNVLSGFVLIDNWPEDVSPHDTEQLPYLPQGMTNTLSENTVYWSAQHWNKKPHYEVHNIYGLQQFQSLKSVTDLDNPFIMSSSCSLGSPACLNQQNISPYASWTSLKEVITSVIGKGLAGVALSGGGSVCGTEGDISEDLCLRWYMLGVVLPVMRVSSTYPLRDPLHSTSSFMLRSVTSALKLRYSLLPYLYTLLCEASRTGAPILRPMFYEFPHDPATWNLQQQFMVGPALLAAPGLRSDVTLVQVYLPASNATWFLLEGGLEVGDGAGNITVPISSTEAQLVLLIRAGHVLPTQEPGTDTRSSRLGSYKLVIALDCDTEGQTNCSATGQMTLEENVTVTFNADSTSVTIGNLHEVCSKAILQPLTEITVLKSARRSPNKSTTYQSTSGAPLTLVSLNASVTSIASMTPAKSTNMSVLKTTVSTTANKNETSSSTISSMVRTSGMSTTAMPVDSSPTADIRSTSSSPSGSTMFTSPKVTSSPAPFSSTLPSATYSPVGNNNSAHTSSRSTNNTTETSPNMLKEKKTQHKPQERSKRHIFSRAKSFKTDNDATQPLSYKLNETALCTDKNSIVINYVTTNNAA